MEPSSNPERSQIGTPPSGRRNVVAWMGVVILAGLLFWIVSAIQQHNALQSCIDSGRRDCVSLPAD